MAKVLVVDDDLTLGEMISLKLRILGHECVAAHTLANGFSLAIKNDFDLVLLDVRLPDGSGLELLPELKTLKSNPEVIIITGEGDPDGAELAIETGAWDYLLKPVSMRVVALQVTRALQYRHERLRPGKVVLLKRDSIIGTNPKLEACLEQLALSASTEIPLLITGETGVGKEQFARAVHLNSNRVKEHFVVLDCASLPESLIESVLFGHERGSFTGAHQDRDGLIMQAHKGTLFLDEVGEMPLAMQKSFLRLLQERRFRPVGGKHERTADFRLVASTNRDLEDMVSKGQFRKDLVYRLNASAIHLPPLRERKTDIEALACHYISTFCKRYDIRLKGLSPEFIDLLNCYDWPGNVRELVNAVDHAVTNARFHDALYPTHLPVKIRISMKRSEIEKDSTGFDSTVDRTPAGFALPQLQDSLEDAEKRYLETLMSHTESDIKKACQISGLSRSSLYARLRKYKIPREA